MSITTKSSSRKLIAIFAAAVFFALCLFIGKAFKPAKTQSATLSASATLSNPRLSFRAGITASYALGANVIGINTSAAVNPDYNTSHLFPGDIVCMDDGSNNYKGCRGFTTYTVSRILSTSAFALAAPLSGASGAVSNTNLVIASQSGTLTVNLTVGNTIPANGTILLTIPAVKTGVGSSAAYDGIPDTGVGTTNGGFDLNNIAAATAFVSVSGGTGCTWTGLTTITPGDGNTTNHTILYTTTTACVGTITMTVGTGVGGTASLINPAPVLSGHTQGNADIYTINVKTRDSGANQIDNIDIKVAPVEGVLLSATVDETLSFQVTGIVAGSNACNVSTTVATTPMSVPWGTVSTYDTFRNAAQRLAVSTNALNGYAVTVEENDQMGKEGNVCVGATAGENQNCIQDTTCAVGTGVSCNEQVAANWGVATTAPGFGISLEDISAGSPASWYYNQAGFQSCGGAPSFCARSIADMEAGDTKQTIMTKATPRNNDQINVCFRISVDATQPAGYYYNRLKYTATATF